MRHSKIYLLVTFLALIVFATGCTENSAGVTPHPGKLDFSTYIAVGNSITAGFRNEALFKSGQKYSYPNLLAQQFGVAKTFTQPLISDPGSGGRLEAKQLHPLILITNPKQGKLLNQNEKPFSNLGIPGAILADFLNPGNRAHLKERATNPNNPNYNPFYGIVLEQSELEKPAPNIFDALAKQNPTFITFWLGSNDVLGYVGSGGEGKPITPPSTFAHLYKLSGQALASTGADVVMYNIPNVTKLPFVFLLRSKLQQKGIVTIDANTNEYKLVTLKGNFNIYIDVDGKAEPMKTDDYVLLKAAPYLKKIISGKIPPPISPKNAIPDKLVLDGNSSTSAIDSEVERSIAAIKKYNKAIQNVAAANGFALVNVYNIFNRIFHNYITKGGGYDAGNITLKPVLGSLFSFGGVHPTNRGYAMIANKTIKVINDYYGTNIPLIDISSIPRGLIMASN